MNAPVALDDIVLAEMLWAGCKSMFTVVAIMVVMLGAGHQPQPQMLLAAAGARLGVGITFSCIALIFNALAKSYDFFTYYFTLFLTPMMFLSGVFFPLEQLPGLAAARWPTALPLTAAVELVRPSDHRRVARRVAAAAGDPRGLRGGGVLPRAGTDAPSILPLTR